MITVLTCRGAAEPLTSPNMLTNVTDQLDTSLYVVGQDIPYPASVGPFNADHNPAGPSEEQSIATGLPLVAAAIRATPNLVGLLGYSLGAELVSRFLELKAQGQYQDCELAWAAVVANPNRAPGESIDADSAGEGINGPHAAWPTGIPVFTAANPMDGITSCPPRSPLRDLATGVSPFTFATLDWTPELAASLLEGEWPTADYSPGQLIEAGRLVYGYLFGGQHTTAYIDGGYLDRLATILNQQA
ncbi:hypothetical protein ABIA39_003071 [Nocardia sp. GAS34]